MNQIVITNNPSGVLRDLSDNSSTSATISDLPEKTYTTVASTIANNYIQSILAKNYPIAEATTNKPIGCETTSILPFRISLTNVGVSQVSKTDPRPIGLAIIGYSNYIL